MPPASESRQRKKRRARTAWFAGATLLAAACGAAAAPLSQRDFHHPERVAAWLTANKHALDTKAAQALFQQGIQSKQQRRWGPALKSFGESAIRRPSAPTLIEYAEAHLRLLGEARARENGYAEHQQRDLTSAEQLYRSALAADAAVPELSPQQREQTRRSAGCLAEYVHSGSTQEACEPLQSYGLK
ncbi:hypothetical protein M8A51_08490 [Schlegelella sp. S2-27]|uniref:Uncharacterized protein n=1 Tax=Caldimonas mangrovi TaxID=2944811 RepID=A0ABT0YLF8_9BURK|nr:hypothetical protein [Caldimonas mangrovi]MCM5679569.1 hypothetical protein [Caldimonas mangrovi]